MFSFFQCETIQPKRGGGHSGIQLFVFSSHELSTSSRPQSSGGSGSGILIPGVSHRMPPSELQQVQAKSSSLTTRQPSGTANAIDAHVLGSAFSQGLSPQPPNPMARHSPEQISDKKQSLHIFIFNLLLLLRVLSAREPMQDLLTKSDPACKAISCVLSHFSAPNQVKHYFFLGDSRGFHPTAATRPERRAAEGDRPLASILSFRIIDIPSDPLE